MKFFNLGKHILFLKYVSQKRLLMKKNIIKNFKKAIKNNIDYIQITNPIAEQDIYFRATGKTTSIIKLANKYNLPILSKGNDVHIRFVCNELELDLPVIYHVKDTTLLRGMRKILVDETVTINDIKKIKNENPMIKIIGFARIKIKNK